MYVYGYLLNIIATGEPPLCMSCVVPIAIRNALNSARKDAGDNNPWYQLGMFKKKEVLKILENFTNV